MFMAGPPRREEKTSGLGETSKDVWSIEDEDDASKKQILNEKKQHIQDLAQAEPVTTGFRRKAPKVAEKKPKKPAVLDVGGNDLDDLDDLMGGDSSPKMNGLNNDEADFFGGGRSNDDDYKPRKKNKKDDDDPLAFLKKAEEEKEQKAQRNALRE